MSINKRNIRGRIFRTRTHLSESFRLNLLLQFFEHLIIPTYLLLKKNNSHQKIINK